MNEKRSELTRKKWTRTEKGVILQEYPDYETTFVFAINGQAFVNTDIYQAMQQWLASDPIFSTAPGKVGYWGMPRVLIQRILLGSMSLKDEKVMVDPTTAKSLVSQIVEYLNATEVIYEARARLLGVELTTPGVPITDGAFLVKLTDEEINERQPYIEFPDSYTSSIDSLNHYTEIRMTVSAPVDSNVEVPILSTQNTATSKARIMSDDILSALRLYKPGLIELGPISLSSSFISGFSVGRIYALPIVSTQMQLGASDIDSLQEAYRVVTECQSSDKVLERALHRFFLGRQRYDLLDRLVDYVIAWESILLTVDRNALEDELSYRFGINGASILNSSELQKNRDAGLRMMKGIYSIRSKIVHGASDKDINKTLNKAGFNSIVEVDDDIEEKFRGVIFWLSRLNVNDRPYNKPGGWEQLLWGGWKPADTAT